MKRSWRVSMVMLVFAVVAAACTSGGGNDQNNGNSSGSSGPIKLTMWVGYTPPPPENQSFEYLSIDRMVKAFEAQNKDITIELQYVNSDNALQKATVAIQGNQQPDISYQYGTNMAQLAATPKIVDLTDRVNAASYNWGDFYPGEQAVATVDGRVLGVPALVDNLAVVYNKDLFAKAGIPRTHRRLDLGRPAGRREGHHRPREQGVRAGVPRRRQRDHGVGVRSDALGRRRRDPEQTTRKRPSTRLKGFAPSRRSPTSTKTARPTSTSSPIPASPDSCSTPAISG